MKDTRHVLAMYPSPTAEDYEGLSENRCKLSVALLSINTVDKLLKPVPIHLGSMVTKQHY